MKKKMKQSPPWQDLNPFILSMIFSYLSLHDQLFGPPFVCHSWLSASLHGIFPNSQLDLRLIDFLDDEDERLRFTHLLRLALNHYHGWISIYLPSKHVLGYFATLYIAEKTPNISCLVQSSEDCRDLGPVFTSLLYWKDLKVFRAGLNPLSCCRVLTQLADLCRGITELCIHGRLMEKEASCIAEGFPMLKLLDISRSRLAVGALYIVLDGRLKHLKELNILECSFMGDHGEDICGDYVRMKEFKNKVLRRVSGLRSLRNFKHGLAEICLYIRDNFLKERK